MFRFDSFKKNNTSSPNNNSSPDLTANDPLLSQPTTNATEQLQQAQSPISFLQRIASSDTILSVGGGGKKPNNSIALQKSSSSSSSSFSIPIPTNSWGMLALSRLQDEQDDELLDIVQLLLTKDKVRASPPSSPPYQT